MTSSKISRFEILTAMMLMIESAWTLGRFCW